MAERRRFKMEKRRNAQWKMVLKKTGAIFRTWPVDSGVKVQS